ncbi:nucleotidyltransferase domain-containing protein [Jeotgalibacillus sp. R-1-5s-1]|uniref:nucleotidyltransferase domain-containing protein n=1 Tax=Jeotgalibacillus sp. R-1-5s-1 TaxID=2555897 RepID=UPI00106CFCE6|nr:hypothetical protein [Jeotgalibacillus sp. R-1-5s-1]TFE00146.1 hypothetical protein E2491_06825 [Jeotgalibacillus sp. R-1-5s-1]
MNMDFKQCHEIRKLMTDFPAYWFMAGGWAIDLAIGRKTRDHHDIEIGVLRGNQQAVFSFFTDWSFRKVVRGEFHSWQGEQLALPVHELHGGYQGLNLEVLLNEHDQKDWIFRRDQLIRRPLEKSILHFGGIPCLAPEIVLLYKASKPRAKDEEDFENILPFLQTDQASWLNDALKIHKPDHHWINELKCFT